MAVRYSFLLVCCWLWNATPLSTLIFPFSVEKVTAPTLRTVKTFCTGNLSKKSKECEGVTYDKKVDIRRNSGSVSNQHYCANHIREKCRSGSTYSANELRTFANVGEKSRKNQSLRIGGSGGSMGSIVDKMGYIGFNDVMGKFRNIKCTSDYSRNNQVIEDVKRRNKPRFIHPQVFKMFHRARYLMNQGNSTTAQKLLVRCLELNPYDSYSWLALARLESKVGNFVRARDIFQQAIQKCPDNVHILHAWGHLEQKHGNEVLARKCWSRAVEIEPYNPYVCHALSNLEKRQRNYENAKSILEVVVMNKPTAALCVSLADLERQLGHPEKARDVLLYGLQVCRFERSKLCLALAWLEEDAFKNQEKAARLISKALCMDKENVRVYVAKASMELRLDRKIDAMETLRHAVKLNGYDGQHFTMLGTLELELGNVEESLIILKEGAEKYPGDQFLLQRWGTLEAKLGNVERARYLYKKSVLIQPHAPTFVAWAILEEKQGMQEINVKVHKSHPWPEMGVVYEIEKWNHTLNSSKPDNVDSPIEEKDVNHLGSLDPSKLLNLLEGLSFTNKDMNAFLTLPPLSHVADPVSNTYVQDQVQKARYLFTIGQKVDPQHGPLYHAFGNMELRQGNISGARNIFARGISMNCSDVMSLFHAWGLLELHERNVDKAAEIFAKGIELGLKGSREIENGVSFLLHSLGMLELVDRRRCDEAEKIFSTGVSLFPKHSQMQLGLAMVSMRLGAQEKARKCFKFAVDADPFHAHAWQAWAVAEKQCGNYELARNLFRQGLKMNPSHGALWQAFAVMEMHQNNFEIARSLFSQALARCPEHAQSYQAWACLEVRLGNLKKAKALAFRGIMLIPSHPALWTVAGLIEDKLGNVRRAEYIFRRALERFPNHGALYKVLGEMELRKGRYVKAKQIFNEGIILDPYCAPLYHTAALLEAKLGNLGEIAQGVSIALDGKFQYKSENTAYDLEV